MKKKSALIIFLMCFHVISLFSLQLQLKDGSVVDLPDNLAMLSGTLKEMQKDDPNASVVILHEITPELFPVIANCLALVSEQGKNLKVSMSAIIKKFKTEKELARFIDQIYFLDIPELFYVVLEATHKECDASTERNAQLVHNLVGARTAYLNFRPRGIPLQPKDGAEGEYVYAPLSLASYSETLNDLIHDMVEGSAPIAEKAKDLMPLPIPVDTSTLSLLINLFDAARKACVRDSDSIESLLTPSLISLLSDKIDSISYSQLQRLIEAALFLNIPVFFDALMEQVKLQFAKETSLSKNQSLKELLSSFVRYSSDSSILDMLIPTHRALSFESQKDPFFFANFSYNGLYLGAITHKGVASVWKIQPPDNPLSLFKVPSEWPPVDAPFQISFSPTHILFSNMLVSVPLIKRNAPIVIDYAGKVIPPSGVNFLGMRGNAALSPTANNLEVLSSAFQFSNDPDSHVRFCDISGNVISTNNKPKQWNHGAPVFSVSFSRDGNYSVSVSSNKVNVWDQEGKIVSEIASPSSQPIVNAYFSPQGTYVAVSYKRDRDYGCSIYDVRTGKLMSTSMGGHTEKIVSVSFSPDENYFLTASQGEGISVWNCASGKKHFSLQQQGRAVQSAFFSPIHDHVAIAYKLATSNPQLSNGKLEIVSFPFFASSLAQREQFKKEIVQSVQASGQKNSVSERIKKALKKWIMKDEKKE